MRRTPAGTAAPVNSGEMLQDRAVTGPVDREALAALARPPTPEETAAYDARRAATEQDAQPAPERAVITDERAYAIQDELAADDEWYKPNPLNRYLNAAYHFRFCMASDSDFLSAQNGGGSLIDAYDDVAKVVLAESGVTAGFNIKEVRIQQKVGIVSPEQMQNGVAKFDITIIENLGTSFLEKMKNAALKLRIKNIRECPYFLELYFMGYDEDGAPVTNLLADDDLGQGGRWVYSLGVSKIKTAFESQGSEYQIEARPFSSITANSEAGRISDMITIKGRTVGEMLTSLAEALSTAQDERHGFPLVTYKFTTHPITNYEGEDLSTFSIAPPDPELNDASNLTMDESGIPTIQIRGGTIAGAVNTILASSARVQELAKNIPTTSEVDTSEEQSTESRVRESIVFQIEPEVVNGEFDHVSGKYASEVNVHIHGLYTQSPIVSRQQVEDAKDPAVQAQMITKLRENGLLHKRYDYLFTGKNTEVINVDTNFEFAWSAVLPLVYGHRMTNESVTTHARFNENVMVARGFQAELTALRDQIREANLRLATAQEELAELDSEDDGYEAKNAEVAAISAERNTLQAQSDAKNEQLSNSRIAVRDTAPEQDSLPSGTIFYAEDLDEVSQEDQMLAISFSQQDTRAATGEGASAPYHRDRGLYGAILDQLYTGQMLSIDLEIRGDPFWLGQSDIERREANAASATARAAGTPAPAATSAAADFFKGENTILFTMAFPFTVDDDGGVIMRENDAGSRKDLFDGFYTVAGVEHIFEGGQFRQTLDCKRLPLIAILNSQGLQSENQAQFDAAQGNAPPGDTGAPSDLANAGAAAPAATGTTAQNMTIMYDQLRRNGYTEEGAKTMVAQIGRENGFQPDIMFGSHDDPYNRARNSGIMSWQGERADAVRAYMQQRGFVNRDGTFSRSEAALRAQVDFMHQELQTAPYRRSYNAMRAPGGTYQTIESVVGDNYVRWRRTDPVYSANGYRNQNRAYNQINQLVGGT
jgi:hypothetical protein